MSADVPPNQTLYVNNLYEKLTKDELRKSLYAVFGQFGKVLDVVCLKTYRMRGQAWVVFEDVVSATNALHSMQRFPFFDKPMRITYATSKSDAAAKADGTFQGADKKARSKRNTTARDALLQKGKERKTGAGPAASAQGSAAAQNTAAGTSGPNKILFVQSLPETATVQMIQMLFSQFPGFQEVRMVEARPGIAFVEYEADSQATAAMKGLQDFKITPQNAISISYAKA